MGKRLPRPAPTGIEQLIERVGDATGINREMSRREFLKKVGGATLAGVAKKALGPLPEAEQAAAALGPIRQPRLLSDRVAKAFDDIPAGVIAASGPNKVVYFGGDHELLDLEGFEKLQAMMARARDAAPNAPEGVTSYWNPMTNQWHQKVWRNVDPTQPSGPLYEAIGIPPSESPFDFNGLYHHRPVSHTRPLDNSIDVADGFYTHHYLPAGESLDPRLDINPWDMEYAGKPTQALPPGSWHSETLTETYLPEDIADLMSVTKGGLTGGQIGFESDYWKQFQKGKAEWANNPESNTPREEIHKIAQDNQKIFNTPYGAVLRPGEPQPSGMSYGPLGGILLDEPEQPARRGRAFTKGVRNSLYGAGTAAVLSQLLDENEDPKERY